MAATHWLPRYSNPLLLGMIFNSLDVFSEISGMRLNTLCWIVAFLCRAIADKLILLVPSMDNNEESAISKSRLLAPLVLDNRRRYCSLTNIHLVEETLKAGSEASAKKFKTEVIARVLKKAIEEESCLWLDNDVLIVDPKWEAFDSKLKMKDIAMCKDEGDDDRYQSGVIYARANGATRAFFDDLALQMKQESSDQRTLNGLLQKKNKVVGVTITDLNKSIYNAFPHISSAEWKNMQRGEGDEEAHSKLVHFAGQYGGADSETGKVDSMVMLISFKEFASRHLTFLLGVTEARRERRRLAGIDDATFGTILAPHREENEKGDDGGSSTHDETEEDYLGDMDRARGGGGGPRCGGQSWW